MEKEMETLSNKSSLRTLFPYLYDQEKQHECHIFNNSKFDKKEYHENPTFDKKYPNDKPIFDEEPISK